MSVQYKCHYEFGNQKKTTSNSVNTLVNFSKGFWIDDSFNFSDPLDESTHRYFIPFHRVFYVQKIPL